MIGPKVGEKNGVDAVGSQAGPLVKSGRQCGGWQAGIDKDVAVAGPDERCGGMRGSLILRLIPQTIAAGSADADDVQAGRRRGGLWDPMTGNAKCQAAGPD